MQKLLLGFFLSAVVPWSAFGQAAHALSATQAATVDAAVTAEMARQRDVGAAVGILQGDEVVYLRGYGYADAGKRTPVTTRTMFRWASISKTLTAVAAMQLAERHQLDLDADVRGYVPEFPDKGVTITARSLLCHQSGIPHYANGKIIVTHAKYTVPHPFEEVVTALDRFKESPLLFPPGDRFSYSTYGFLLLGAVVQRAGRQPYAEQVRERIVKPLGLETLQPDYQWEAIPDRAAGYFLQGGEVVPSTDTDVSWKLPGGGYLSNVGDLALWAQALLRRRLLSADSYDALWKVQNDAHGKATAWGLGFEVQTQNGNRKVSHNGRQEKASCRLVLYPDQHDAVVVMTNCDFADPGRLSTAVYKALGGAASMEAETVLVIPQIAVPATGEQCHELNSLQQSWLVNFAWFLPVLPTP